MSFIDLEKAITSDNPNFFKIGDVVLSVSVDNIQVSRHENFQAVSYLRDMHAMKIHTGRSQLRVNISFPILVDKQLRQLQSLVAMTRVTPFVPIQNRFLQGQLKIYDTSATVFEMNKTPDSKSITKIQKTLTGNAYTSKNEPTFLEALPMAIMGMAVTMGGDSPELAECSMSLIFWNPMPWFGIDLQYWKEESLLGLRRDYSRYIKSKINSRSPSSFSSTVFRWWDIKLYSELNERFAKEIAEAIKNAPGPGTPKQSQIEEELIRSDADNQVHFSDFNNYLKFASKHTTVDQLLEGIAAVETNTYGKNSGWDKTNDNTWVAGRYQMSAETYRGLVFEGRDVPGGVPLKDRFIEELAGSPALQDAQLNVQMRGGGMASPGKNLNDQDKEQWAKWYARPKMAELQTFVSTEFLKGLYKKHDNDSVKASLEYFLGATDAKPYIKHWETHHTIKDWEKGDTKRLGTHNQSPIQYMRKAFGSMSSSGTGFTYDNSIQAGDSNILNLDGSGPVPRNRRGDLLGAGIEPVIPTVVHDKLRELGWEQIALLEGGRPNPNIINPLFKRIEANIIDLEAGGVSDSENQVVTSITISFQNRFASLPVQGWPYPALQHMGSIDSELRLTISCLSDSQQYNRLQQAQSMLHIMANRARRYHADVHDAREILQLSRLACDNRLINQLGINDVVMTDLTVQIDPESPNLARGEIVMSESAFDPNKEKLVASLGKNDRRFRIGLRESWLANERYLESPNSSVVNMGVRLRALQVANDDALAANMDILFESGQLDRVIAQLFNDDDDFREMTVFSLEDQEYYRKQQQEITEFTDFSTKRGLKLKSAKYISPTARVLNTWEIIPVSEFERIHEVVVPVNPDLLLTESLGTKVGDFLKSLYDSDQSATGDPNEIERIKGDASIFLSTSFGLDLLQVWGRLKDQPTAETFHRDMGRFFHLLTKAMHEWYNREILEQMLLLLYRRNESDSTFDTIVAQSRDVPGAGIYKDLLLDREPLTNPYEWLDQAIEPKILSAMEDAVSAAEQNTDVLIKEFRNFLRDDDAILFHQNASTTQGVMKDTSKSAEADAREGLQRFNSGLKSTLNRIGVDAKHAALSLRDFSTVNFTMRRAFPAYRMYFIEEDNQGLIKRFDDFYNYNAIIDIQMIKYKHRPSTMIVTMTNLFGHLDAKTFSDMADKEELAEAIRANAAGGTLVTQAYEDSNGEYQVDADGTVSPLREIMLKPGTKIVMKLGYDNNPDNLPTVFAGQITEITGGAVMTIVCQDWMSELLAGVGEEKGIPTQGGSLTTFEGGLNFGKKLLNLDQTRDLQNTASPRALIQGVLTQRNVVHFGHWQLDKNRRDPNYFGYRKEGSFILKPFAAEDIFGDLLKFFGDDQIEGNSRAFLNIHPLPLPYYNAFGTDIGSVFPTPEERDSMSLWEMIEMQRRLMPNHVAMVRPYGQGDATLYFGPPWGVYIADAFDGELDSTLSDSILNIHNREVFRDMIKSNATITISGLTRFNERVRERITKGIVSWLGFHGKDGAVEIPISIVLEMFKDLLAKEADTNIVGTLNRLAIAGGVLTANPLVSVGLAIGVNQADIQEEKTDFNLMPRLHAGSPDVIIDKWYDLLLSINTRGGFRDDEDTHSVLINVMSQISKTQTAMAFIRSRDEEGFDPSGSVRKALKPVRRWHIATAKHHIIANNIQVNNNFANEVRAGDTVVRYDTELTDRRTRFADRDIPKGASKDPDKSIYMTSLLAEEMRTMYRGQLVLTGNAEIEPHDIIMIFDQTRHMHGAIEVAKVTHIFNQEMGFISIVEPHLIVEQGDYSLSTALTAFFTALVGDIKENEETVAGKATSRVVGGGFVSAGALTYLATGPVTTGLAVNYIFTQLLASDARNHPLTIYPLVKRMVPWIGGIDGASGRGVIGVLAGKVIKGLKTVRKAVTALSDRVGDVADSAKVIPGALNTTGARGTSSDTPNLGNFSK